MSIVQSQLSEIRLDTKEESNGSLGCNHNVSIQIAVCDILSVRSPWTAYWTEGSLPPFELGGKEVQCRSTKALGYQLTNAHRRQLIDKIPITFAITDSVLAIFSTRFLAYHHVLQAKALCLPYILSTFHGNLRCGAVHQLRRISGKLRRLSSSV